MESFGKYLKEEREKRGYSIEEISQGTKISPGQIRALESDDFGYLPPITFVKGFVRAYARHIGLDSDEAVTRLEEYLSEIEENERDYFSDDKQPQFRRASPDPRLLIAATAIFLVLVILSIILAGKGCAGDEEAGRWRNHAGRGNSLVTTGQENPSGLPRSFHGEVVEAAPPAIPREYFQVLRPGFPRSAPGDQVSVNESGLMGGGPAPAQ